MGEREDRTGSCALCARRDPVPEDAPVCAPCRSWLAGMLREVPELCAELSALGYVQRDRRRKWAAVLDDDHEVRVETDQPADPVAHYVTSGPVPGASRAPRVRGTADRGVPARFDLLGPPDTRSVRDVHMVPAVRTSEPEWVTALFGGRAVHQKVRRREVVHDADGNPVLVPSGDQTGAHSVAAVLRGWVCAWWEDRRGPYHGERLPEDRSVTASARWLRDRSDWACSELGSVADFAEEVRAMHLALRRALGLTDPTDEHCDGVPCRSVGCDRKLLYRIAGTDRVECDHCGRLYTLAEFDEWVKLVRAPLCGRKKGDWWCALPKRHEGDCQPAESVVPPA